MAQVDVSASPVVGSGGAWDGFVVTGMGCSGAKGIPRWCWMCLRMAVCWVWVAKIYSWWARIVVISWARLSWEVVSVCNVWHRALYSEMGMAILGSDEKGGSDIAGKTEGVLGVVGRAKGIPSGMGSVDALLAAGILAACGSSGCCGCGNSGCSALYVFILVHLSRVNTSRQMRLRSSWGSAG